MRMKNILLNRESNRALLFVLLALLVGGCVSNKPIINYSPEEIATLKISLEGKGAIKQGRYTHPFGDWVWTCTNSPPFHVTIKTNDGQASVKLKAYGRIYRLNGAISDNGEISTTFDLGPTGEFDTHHFAQTTVQLKSKRAKILVNAGKDDLVGCPTGWFDLAEIKT